MQVICINGEFSSEILEFWAKFSVISPIQDKLYNIRGVKKHSNGQTGVFLEELVNPKVPINNVGMVMWLEPSFNHTRFARLNGTVLTKEMLEEVDVKELDNIA